MKKRLLSILLTLCMVLTLLPTVALAADGSDQSFTVTGGALGTDYTYASGVLTVCSSTDITIKNTDPSTATTDRIEVTSAADITLNGVNIDVSASWPGVAAFQITDTAGAVNITLADGSVNTLKSGYGCAGMQKDTIGADTMLAIDGTGTLNATSGGNGAGIGGGQYGDGSYITINGGTVNATGGGNGAGIGGGIKGDGNYITISGGTVNATGGDAGAGIGGGAGNFGGGVKGDCSHITISGGTVNATGGTAGAGIGGGAQGVCSDITISGGTVKATRGGGGMSTAAADIGNGADSGGTASIGVQLCTLTLSGVSSATAVMGLTLPCSYGTDDIKTDADGKLYLYLPSYTSGAVTATTAAGTYVGSIPYDTTLMPSYAITAPAATNGSYTVTVDGSTVTSATPGDTVTITPTANSGYELDAVSVCKTGEPSTTVTVAENSFTMPAYAVTVTVTFRQPPVSIAAIAGVTAPVAGGTPVTTITECDQYTGTVSWSPIPATTFNNETIYTATITLSPKTGYALAGVTENFFRVAGANEATNSAGSGVITAVFPATGVNPEPNHCSWTNVTTIGFNYGENKFINITMPTTDYFTYGTADGGTAAEIASNAKILPASGWNWAVKKETTIIDSVTYDYTLTLNDFDVSSTTTENDGLMFKTSLNLVLNGTNNINTPNGGVALSGYYGCNLHISGTGSLTATGSANGICCQEKITIAGGTIDAYSTTADGIASGSVTITGGTVTAQGGTGAFNIVPTLSNVAALGSVNDNGTGATAYNRADNDTYKWFYSAPGTAYTVTFANGDGTGTNPTRDAVGENYTFALPSNPYTRDGFTFAGWNDGTNTYQPGATYTMPANNVTFTAQWTQNAPPSSGGDGGSDTPLVTNIDNGGSTTGSNLNRLISKGKTLTVNDDNGAKLVFDTEALKGIGSQTSGNIKVEMKDVSTDHQDNQPGKTVFSLTLTSGDKTITDFSGSATVSLPYELKDGETAADVTVWYLANDGTMTEIPCTYDPATGLATFTVTHFSLYVVGVPWVNPFTDVTENDWFYGAVEFVNRNGLFAGTGTDTFSPDSVMTREMLWTVLGRLDGQTLSGSGVFDAARSWAMGAGITDGTNPGGSITREQMVTILWRYAGSPKDVGELGKFSDAGSVADYAANAMSWAVENGIVAGANGALLPQDSATRAQVAAILQRFIEAAAK